MAIHFSLQLSQKGLINIHDFDQSYSVLALVQDSTFHVSRFDSFLADAVHVEHQDGTPDFIKPHFRLTASNT